MLARARQPAAGGRAPPNATSPSIISTIGTAPPSAVKLSCIAFTAPQLAAVVTAANSAEALMPKRTSLPSRLPAAPSTPSAVSRGLAWCSKCITATTDITNSSVIAASTTKPWRRSPTMRPKTRHNAAGMAKIASICSRLANALGFSNGCALLALKKPPPLVPSSLIASCEATGPIASVCVPASSVCTSTGAEKFWITPRPTSATAKAKASGRSTHSVMRVRSTQTLPMLALLSSPHPHNPASWCW